MTWVVTADIDKFFDNVEHRILAEQIRNTGVNDARVRLILKWLLAPAHDRGHRYQTVKGLPQGSPVAPVLANLYLTGFDTALEAEGFAHVRYADDFVVLARDEAEARRALGYVPTVPTESIDRFKVTLTTLLHDDSQRHLPDVAKSHNDLVRGWRHYYFGNSPEMDRQLTDLDVCSFITANTDDEIRPCVDA